MSACGFEIERMGTCKCYDAYRSKKTCTIGGKVTGKTPAKFNIHFIADYIFTIHDLLQLLENFNK